MTDGSDPDWRRTRPESEVNPATVWAGTLVTELVAGGLDTVCIAPGSRSTPLSLAFDAAEGVETCSIIDERSAGYVAIGRGKATGEPTAVLTTSGTATANLHPAVIEAHHSRTPVIILTADRPPELQDTGANQTVDQDDLYNNATRWARTLQVPTTDRRSLRSLRTTAARAISLATGTPAGPVHLNCPFRKPLEPKKETPDSRTVPNTGSGPRGTPAVEIHQGTPTLPRMGPLLEAIQSADRGLIVAGPADPGLDETALPELASTIGFPIFADPLSGLRWGPHVDRTPLCAGYDGYLHAIEEWVHSRSGPSDAAGGVTSGPDLVLRFGGAPTSKRLREWLSQNGGRQVLIDPAGGWREATFSATDLVTAQADRFASALCTELEGASTAPDDSWCQTVQEADRAYWTLLDDARRPPEASVVAEAIDAAPAGTTLVVGNSTPVRDADRFAPPQMEERTVLGNRGASGIDGVTSTAIGVAHASDGPTACVLGDCSVIHDMSGLTAIERCGVDLTLVVVNNDGGGIFHALPIADFNPPFTELFRTPHDVDLSAAAASGGIEHVRTAAGSFRSTFRTCLETDAPQLLEVRTDAAGNHRIRERIDDRVVEEFGPTGG